MAFRSARDRLEDIAGAIPWLDRVLAGRTSADDHRRDRALRAIVERNLERIPEASRPLPATMEAEHPAIPWADIAKPGNRLRHGYDSIDHDIIWSIATLELPALQTAIQAMLQQQQQQGDDA